MDQIELVPGDEYDKKCGEVFLTVNGNIIFHCLLCEEKYRGIKEYAVHVIEKHYDPTILEEDCMSTYSSDFYEEHNKQDESQNVTEIAIEEEEDIKLSHKHEEKYTPIISKIPVVEDFEPDLMILKWVRPPFINENPEHRNHKQENISGKKISSKALKPPVNKPLTEAEMIRIANEKARCINTTKFKKPVARRNLSDSERKHKCNFCGFAFKDPSNLIAHIKRHAKNRTFQCAICSKMFCTRTEIEHHTRRHEGEKPFLCTYDNCDKAYFTRSELNVHIKKRHLKKRDHKCDECGRGFFDKWDLREHMVSHSQERNYKCLVCEAKFSRREALTNHLKIHENRRQYECNICDASFNQKAGLSSHLKNKHKMT